MIHQSGARGLPRFRPEDATRALAPVPREIRGYWMLEGRVLLPRGRVMNLQLRAGLSRQPMVR